MIDGNLMIVVRIYIPCCWSSIREEGKKQHKVLTLSSSNQSVNSDRTLFDPTLIAIPDAAALQIWISPLCIFASPAHLYLSIVMLPWLLYRQTSLNNVILFLSLVVIISFLAWPTFDFASFLFLLPLRRRRRYRFYDRTITRLIHTHQSLVFLIYFVRNPEKPSQFLGECGLNHPSRFNNQRTAEKALSLQALPTSTFSAAMKLFFFTITLD